MTNQCSSGFSYWSVLLCIPPTFQVQTDCIFENTFLNIFFSAPHLHCQNGSKKAYYYFHTEMILFKARSWLCIWLKCQHSDYTPVFPITFVNIFPMSFSSVKGKFSERMNNTLFFFATLAPLCYKTNLSIT